MSDYNIYQTLLDNVTSSTTEDELLQALTKLDYHLMPFDVRDPIYNSEVLLQKTHDVLVNALTRATEKPTIMKTLACIYQMAVSFLDGVKTKFATEQVVNFVVQKGLSLASTSNDVSLIVGRVMGSLAAHPQGAKLLATKEVRDLLVEKLPLDNFCYDDLFAIGRILHCRDAVPIFADTSSPLLDVIRTCSAKLNFPWQVNNVQRDVIKVLETFREGGGEQKPQQAQTEASPHQIIGLQLLRIQALAKQVDELTAQLAKKDAEIIALKDENEQLRQKS